MHIHRYMYMSSAVRGLTVFKHVQNNPLQRFGLRWTALRLLGYCSLVTAFPYLFSRPVSSVRFFSSLPHHHFHLRTVPIHCLLPRPRSSRCRPSLAQGHPHPGARGSEEADRWQVWAWKPRNQSNLVFSPFLWSKSAVVGKQVDHVVYF